MSWTRNDVGVLPSRAQFEINVSRHDVSILHIHLPLL